MREIPRADSGLPWELQDVLFLSAQTRAQMSLMNQNVALESSSEQVTARVFASLISFKSG